MKGLADAIADPTAAVRRLRASSSTRPATRTTSPPRARRSAGRPSRRWWSTGPRASPSGWSIPALLKAEVDAYSAAGVFDSPVSMDGTYNTDLVEPASTAPTTGDLADS